MTALFIMKLRKLARPSKKSARLEELKRKGWDVEKMDLTPEERKKLAKHRKLLQDPNMKKLLEAVFG